MFIAHVTFCVPERDRPEVLRILLTQVPAVREMKGCLAFIPFLDPTRADGVGVLHEWVDQDHFAGYLESPEFALSGKEIRPLMTGAPVSRRFNATLVSTAN